MIANLMPDGNLKINEWRNEFSKEVCTWKYPVPYDIYNLPSYEEMQEACLGFANKEKEKSFRAVILIDALVGFFNLVNEEEIFLGIGLHPDFCSMGYGYKVLLMAIEESKHLYGNKSIYLDVREWNIRAIKSYLKVGFKIQEKIEQSTYVGEGNFVRMRYFFS